MYRSENTSRHKNLKSSQRTTWISPMTQCVGQGKLLLDPLSWLKAKPGLASSLPRIRTRYASRGTGYVAAHPQTDHIEAEIKAKPRSDRGLDFWSSQGLHPPHHPTVTLLPWVKSSSHEVGVSMISSYQQGPSYGTPPWGLIRIFEFWCCWQTLNSSWLRQNSSRSNTEGLTAMDPDPT